MPRSVSAYEVTSCLIRRCRRQFRVAGRIGGADCPKDLRPQRGIGDFAERQGGGGQRKPEGVASPPPACPPACPVALVQGRQPTSPAISDTRCRQIASPSP